MSSFYWRRAELKKGLLLLRKPFTKLRILCVLVLGIAWNVVAIQSIYALQDDLVELEKANTQEVTSPLLSPEEAVKAWRLPQGFRVNLFAHEPDVHQPIAMAFDERGRLWVIENYTYSDNDEEFSETLRDRVVIFEDEDQDGKFDSRTIFWDCLLYTSPSPRDGLLSRMPSSA